MKTARQLIEYIRGGGADETFVRLYGSAESARERYIDLLEDFCALYGEQREAIIVSAPGRAEIGGNHTDHQHGCVLAAALRLDIVGVASPRADMTARLKSRGFEEDVADLNLLTPVEKEIGKSVSLIRGVAAAFKNLGAKIGGFDCVTVSDVLKGSGISSSAAFEVLVGAVFNHLYNGGNVSHVDEAKSGQYAENVFFGKPSGLMDQMASAVGGFVGIDFNNPAQPVVTPVDFDFEKTGYSLCIVDTGDSHVDLTEEYAAIRTEMNSVAQCFGKEVLRDVDEREFFARVARVRDICGDRAVLRAIHFFADTRRAAQERIALESGDFDLFLKLVNESGESSFMYNQNVFAPSDPSHQGIAVALALTQRFLGDKGAYRLQGGGFGGTIQAYVPVELTAAYAREIDAVMGKGSCKPMSVRPDGSRVVVS